MSLRWCALWAPAEEVVSLIHDLPAVLVDPWMNWQRAAKREVSLLELDPSLKSLFGSMCWNVSYGLDNLSMELGSPVLRVIHDPVASMRASHEAQDIPIGFDRWINRRHVSVTGQWHLWVYLAYWRIVRSGVCLASKSWSWRKMRAGLLDLQGQRLIAASVNRESGATRFEFDLDTVLEVRRMRGFFEDELWLLYGPPGRCQRSVRGNGTFTRTNLRL